MISLGWITGCDSPDRDFGLITLAAWALGVCLAASLFRAPLRALVTGGRQ